MDNAQDEFYEQQDQFFIDFGCNSNQIDENIQNNCLTTKYCDDIKRKPEDQMQFAEVLVEQFDQSQQISSSPYKIVKKVAKRRLQSETKNIGKNFGQAFKTFLVSTLSPQQINEHGIEEFLKTPKNELGLQNFRDLIKNSNHLTKLAEHYFGSFGWAKTFVGNNKTDLKLYFRYPNIWRSKR